MVEIATKLNSNKALICFTVSSGLQVVNSFCDENYEPIANQILSRMN